MLCICKTSKVRDASDASDVMSGQAGRRLGGQAGGRTLLARIVEILGAFGGLQYAACGSVFAYKGSNAT